MHKLLGDEHNEEVVMTQLADLATESFRLKTNWRWNLCANLHLGSCAWLRCSFSQHRDSLLILLVLAIVTSPKTAKKKKKRLRMVSLSQVTYLFKNSVF
jgi:hypothetical protein